MAEQFKVAVPQHERVDGWLYDYDSGLCMGIASVEQKAKYPKEKQPFSLFIAGCPHKVVIHSGPIKVVTDPKLICEWTYTRSRGDIEVFAPNADEAERLVKETGMVKNFNPKKLAKTGKNLSDILKREAIK